MTGKYVSAEALMDWLDEYVIFGDAKLTAADLVEDIREHLMGMPYMDKGTVHPADWPWNDEPAAPAEPDPFARADFEHDDMLEDEWNG